MAKSFMGNATLQTVLTLFKTQLAKKQDTMTEFTDEEIQNMWDTEPAEGTEPGVE